MYNSFPAEFRKNPRFQTTRCVKSKMIKDMSVAVTLEQGCRIWIYAGWGIPQARAASSSPGALLCTSIDRFNPLTPLRGRELDLSPAPRLRFAGGDSTAGPGSGAMEIDRAVRASSDSRMRAKYDRAVYAIQRAFALYPYVRTRPRPPPILSLSPLTGLVSAGEILSLVLWSSRTFSLGYFSCIFLSDVLKFD